MVNKPRKSRHLNNRRHDDGVTDAGEHMVKWGNAAYIISYPL